MLCSGSADKNIKLWGLDFGNVHRSIFAHASAVLQVSFIKDTHYLVSISKDQVAKFWDMDTYENIFQFDKSIHPLSAMVVTSIGDRVYISDMGGPIHIYGQTKEQAIYSDEVQQRENKESLE